MDPIPDNPRVLVVGAGALGLYYGGRMRQVGLDVAFLARSGAGKLRSEGLHVSVEGGPEFILQDVPIYTDAEDCPPVDVVVLAVKATANPDLAPILGKLDTGSNRYVTLQNGLGNVEFLAQIVGPERVFATLCFVCVNRVAPNAVENYLPGSVAVGAFVEGENPDTAKIARLFELAGIETRVTDHLAEALWRKLVWNVPFNGLAIAAGGIETDAILADPALEALTRDLMSEIIAAAAAHGVELQESFIEKQVGVTRKMGAYKPSSLIDFRAGRAVEVEPIWGEPLRRAREKGLVLPRLETLYRLLLALTRQN